MALYMPSAFGRVGKRGKPGKADEICEDFVSIYQGYNTYPTDIAKSWRYTDEMQYRQDRPKGIKRNCQLRDVLFTQARKLDPQQGSVQAERGGRASHPEEIAQV